MHIHWSPLSARNMSSRPHTRSMLILSHISQQNSIRCVPTRSLCQRTQAGHTNRWQLAGPLGSDLLGQAQVQRAEEFPNKSSSHRKIKSADPMAQHWREDATFCPESPLLHLVHPLSASTHTRLCNDVTFSTKLDSAEKQFNFLSRQVAHYAKPDAVLECLGGRWELHCSFISRSDTLYVLYTNSKRQRDVQLQDRAVGGKWSRAESSLCRTGRGLLHRKWNLTGPLTLRLSVKEPSITKEALSFALRALYDPEERPDEWGEGVIATAALLGMSNLFHKCLKEMLMNISASTVCSFHQVSCKFKDTGLQTACERWLELFLVTELSCHITLKDLTFDLLLKTLCSPRDTRVFLEQPLGQKYMTIFKALRLHGITEWPHLQELQNIRVFPQSCLLHILSKHYHTLYSGGDTAMTDFSKQAVRFGMIVDREQDCCTQTISLYGFYFLLKAAKVGKEDTYSFSIERLRHWDTALSQSFIVTRPFCMRSERLVCYQITVQSSASGSWQEHSSGPVNQEFGLCKRRSRSKVFQIEKLSAPILVMFALAFPL
ncbi:BTB/POZ domain-containing protein 16 isoform X2 [Xyrauchen texanus]|uniref:BTB/POZ domain-containing protein 16 isoform X2 n=1 Tax=Xyrauchen texanus TaxID=154827 RepID=UPI0022418CF6|nr:BTB/POZ domain-containing protein 16 isoform X2 [Xyrauchen texanus]